MDIQQEGFGRTPDGTPVDIHTLTNDNKSAHSIFPLDVKDQAEGFGRLGGANPGAPAGCSVQPAHRMIKG